MALESSQETHRPGVLKQQNKAHKHGRHRSKGAIDNALKGIGTPRFFVLFNRDVLRFEIFTAVRVVVMFFWVLAPYRLVDRCQRFGETYCLQLQG
jgi:hypothetical protein